MENKDFARDVVEKLKELVHKGNATRIQITRDGQVFVTFPVNIGIIAGAVAPWALILATILSLGGKCGVDVLKEDGSTIHVA